MGWQSRGRQGSGVSDTTHRDEGRRENNRYDDRREDRSRNHTWDDRGDDRRDDYRLDDRPHNTWVKRNEARRDDTRQEDRSVDRNGGRRDDDRRDSRSYNSYDRYEPCRDDNIRDDRRHTRSSERNVNGRDERPGERNDSGRSTSYGSHSVRERREHDQRDDRRSDGNEVRRHTHPESRRDDRREEDKSSDRRDRESRGPREELPKRPDDRKDATGVSVTTSKTRESRESASLSAPSQSRDRDGLHGLPANTEVIARGQSFADFLAAADSPTSARALFEGVEGPWSALLAKAPSPQRVPLFRSETPLTSPVKASPSDASVSVPSATLATTSALSEPGSVTKGPLASTAAAFNLSSPSFQRPIPRPADTSSPRAPEKVIGTSAVSGNAVTPQDSLKILAPRTDTAAGSQSSIESGEIADPIASAS